MSMNVAIPSLTGYPTIAIASSDEITASAVTLVENIGVEPMTSCVQGRRSSQLS